MTSEKQVAANRRNAALSTGPRTAAGKARSATNAITHGLQAQAVRMCWESKSEHAEFCRAIRDELAPVGALEELAADQIIAAYWRLGRLAKTEVGMTYHAMARYVRQEYDPDCPLDDLPTPLGFTTRELDEQPETLLASAVDYDLSGAKVLITLDRYRRSLERTVAEQFKQLEHLREQRWAREEAEAAATQSLPNEPIGEEEFTAAVAEEAEEVVKGGQAEEMAPRTVVPNEPILPSHRRTSGSPVPYMQA
jgi:hypothetical protein